MFYNFPALFNHYENFHPDLKVKICLYDGIVFDTHAAFRQHAIIHEKRFTGIKKEEKYISALF